MARLFVAAHAMLLARATGAPPREWQRFTLSDPEALCLDGSRGVYYVLPGVNSTFGNSTFVVHLQGGGWCSSNDDCAARAFAGPVYANEPSLGSSTLWGPGPCSPELSNSTPPCVADGGSGGVLSSNHTLNPTLSDATKVWVGECARVGASSPLHHCGHCVTRRDLAAHPTPHAHAPPSP